MRNINILGSKGTHGPLVNQAPSTISEGDLHKQLHEHDTVTRDSSPRRRDLTATMYKGAGNQTP